MWKRWSSPPEPRLHWCRGAPVSAIAGGHPVTFRRDRIASVTTTCIYAIWNPNSRIKKNSHKNQPPRFDYTSDAEARSSPRTQVALVQESTNVDPRRVTPSPFPALSRYLPVTTMLCIKNKYQKWNAWCASITVRCRRDTRCLSCRPPANLDSEGCRLRDYATVHDCSAQADVSRGRLLRIPSKTAVGEKTYIAYTGLKKKPVSSSIIVLSSKTIYSIKAPKLHNHWQMCN